MYTCLRTKGVGATSAVPGVLPSSVSLSITLASTAGLGRIDLGGCVIGRRMMVSVLLWPGKDSSKRALDGVFEIVLLRQITLAALVARAR